MNGELSLDQVRTYGAWGATLLRVILGVIYVMHGWLALMVTGPDGMAGHVVRLGYPGWLSSLFAWYLIAVHLAGGVLLILGLRTRTAALLQIPIIAAATLQFRWWQGFFLKGIAVDATGRPIAGGYEFDLLVLVTTCAVALLGPGKLSIEDLRGPKFELP